MTVISEVEGVECDEREYPWLGSTAGMVVLFVEHGSGTIVSSEDDCGIGEHDKDWDMDQFEPFTGRVTLSNDDVEVIVLDEDEE